MPEYTIVISNYNMIYNIGRSIDTILEQVDE
jgi:hypothetical protein